MLTVSVVIATIVIIRVLLYYFMLWWEVGATDIWMKYDQFQAIYSVDPTHFEIYNFNDYGPCVRYETNDRYFYIYFKSLSDWIRAKILLKRHAISDNNAIRTKTTLRFLEEIKSKMPKDERIINHDENPQRNV